MCTTGSITGSANAVIAQPAIQMVYIGNYFPTSEVPLIIDEFLHELLMSVYVSGLVQYGVLTNFCNGSVMWTPPNPLPATMDENDVGNMLSQIVSSFPSGNGPGMVLGPGNNAIYILMMPFGTTLTQGGSVSCTPTGFAGYHYQTNVNGQTTQFIAIPWCNAASNPSTQDFGYAGLTKVLSHEIVECMTDPDGSSGWHNGTCELCDVCELGVNDIGQFPIQNPIILPADFLSNWAPNSTWEVSTYFSKAVGACVAPVPGPPDLIGQLVFSSEIAPPGSLIQSQQAPFTLSVYSRYGGLLSGVEINLTFVNQSNATLTANGTAVPSAGAAGLKSGGINVKTVNGLINFIYTAPLATFNGVDTIYASDPANGGNWVYIDYTFLVPLTPQGSFSLNPNPIAAPESLNAGQVVSITFLGIQPNGKPWLSVGLSIFNWFNLGNGQAFGTAVATDATGVPVQLGLNSQTFTPDQNGIIKIQYTAPAPSGLLGMADTIFAQLVTSPEQLDVLYAWTMYTITPAPTQTVSEGGPLATFSFSPSPIAASGSLKAFSWVKITLTAKDASGKPLGYTGVYLSFANVGPSTSTKGAGVVQVYGGAYAGALIGSSPAGLVTDSNGNLILNYQAPYQLPPGGVDTITAQDQYVNPTLVATDKYDNLLSPLFKNPLQDIIGIISDISYIINYISVFLGLGETG